MRWLRLGPTLWDKPRWDFHSLVESCVDHMEDKYFEATITALHANDHEFKVVNLAGHDLRGGTFIILWPIIHLRFCAL